MAKKDYYDALGINKNASEAEIKSAFRKLAKEHHPDVNKNAGSEDKFKEIQEAYAILSDSEKRKQYDQFGHAAFDGSSPGGGGYAGNGAGFDFSSFDFGDVFSDLFGSSFGFGGNSHSARRTKGRDMSLKLHLTFEEAVFGVEKTIKLDVEEECSECSGAGGHGQQNCERCHGSGTITSEQRSLFGSYLTKTTCPTCGGRGFTYKDICGKCHGRGQVKNTKEISVKIPAGVDEESQLKLSSKGERGLNGGPNGDVYIEFSIDKHPLFKRDNDDVYLELPINISEAILGCKKEIPTIYGKVILNIPSGSQSGNKLLLKDKGIANVSSRKKGNMYVVINVVIPNKIDRKQKEIIEELSKTNLESNDIFSKYERNSKKIK